MPKSKRGPALFDLLGEDPAEMSRDLQVPSWWARRSSQQRGQRPAKRAGSTERVHGQGGPDEADLDLEPFAERAETVPSGPVRFLDFDGARLRVSFTTKTAAIAIFAGVVLLVAAFESGSYSGESRGLRLGYEEGRGSYVADALSDIDVARSQPPATHLVEDLLAEPDVADMPDVPEDASTGQTGPTNRSQWVIGDTYVVVQEFSADRFRDGLLAQEFLSQHGVAAELIRLSGGAIQLLSAQGFNRQAPLQRQMADELLAKVHAIGEQYYASGGGYRLKGYFKKLKEAAVILGSQSDVVG